MKQDEYIKKYKLINEYYKRNGYILSEAQDDMGIPDPTMEMQNSQSNNGDMSMPQGTENGNQMNDMAAPQGQEGVENGAPMDTMGGSGGAEGFQPQGEMPQDPNMMQNPIDSEEEEVIDVDDLTDSQEDTEKKVDALAKKFDKLFDMLSDFEDKINKSDANYDELKKEIEKRNPTSIEKMSLRADKGYPFNVSPDVYWDNIEKTSNYRRDDDMNGDNQEQYQITKNDIDNMTDWASISKSLNDEGVFQSLNDILKY